MKILLDGSFRLFLSVSKTNQIEDLLPFVDAILDALKAIMPGEIVPIG
jgi:hypothetical protein